MNARTRRKQRRESEREAAKLQSFSDSLRNIGKYSFNFEDALKDVMAKVSATRFTAAESLEKSFRNWYEACIPKETNQKHNEALAHWMLERLDPKLYKQYDFKGLRIKGFTTLD